MHACISGNNFLAHSFWLTCRSFSANVTLPERTDITVDCGGNELGRAIYFLYMANNSSITLAHCHVWVYPLVRMQTGTFNASIVIRDSYVEVDSICNVRLPPALLVIVLGQAAMVLHVGVMQVAMCRLQLCTVSLCKRRRVSCSALGAHTQNCAQCCPDATLVLFLRPVCAVCRVHCVVLLFLSWVITRGSSCSGLLQSLRRFDGSVRGASHAAHMQASACANMARLSVQPNDGSVQGLGVVPVHATISAGPLVSSPAAEPKTAKALHIRYSSFHGKAIWLPTKDRMGIQVTIRNTTIFCGDSSDVIHQAREAAAYATLVMPGSAGDGGPHPSSKAWVMPVAVGLAVGVLLPRVNGKTRCVLQRTCDIYKSRGHEGRRLSRSRT
jgi:hypothetical protein